jgi:hypothetical protein
MNSSTSSSESEPEKAGTHPAPDSSISWLPPGPDDAACTFYRDPSWLTLIFAGLMVLTIAFTRTDPQKASNPDWYWMMKADWSNETSLVIAGDSRVYRGIDPSSFDQRLNTRALNAGFSSTKLSSPYLEYTRDLINPSAEDPVIIFGVSAFSFTNRRNTGTGYTLAVERNMNRRLPIQAKRALDEVDNLFAPFEPTWILNSIGSMLGLNRSLEENLIATDEEYLQFYHLNGWIASDRNVADADEQWKQVIKDARKLIESREEDIRLFLETTQEWSEQGILVAAFRSPVSSDVAAWEEELFDIDFEQFREDFVEYGGVWLDLPPTLELRQYDGSHIDPISARRLSDELARQIDQLINP